MIVQSTFEFQQATPSTSWVITHNLQRYPAIDIYINYLGTSTKILPQEVTYTNANVCTVTFSSPQSGIALVV